MTAERTRPGSRLTAAILIPLAVIAACVIGIAAIILLDEGEETTPQVEQPPAASPGTGTSTLKAGAVPAGEHIVTLFNPPLKLNIGEGWSALDNPDDDRILLQGTALFVITRVEQVWDKQTQEKITVPDDLAAWFGAHEDFQSGDPVALTIGGYPARQVDLTAMFAADTVHFPPDEFLRIGTGDRSRVVVIDVDGTTVAAIATAEAEDFETAVAQSQPIVESIQFISE
jgi:hypothetical protein